MVDVERGAEVAFAVQLAAGRSGRQWVLPAFAAVGFLDLGEPHDYTWRWSDWELRPQFKFLILRLEDRAAELRLRSEYRVIPILLVKRPLLRRTILQAGVQGLGPAPYRVVVRTNESSSFEQRTAFVTLTNRSRYFGYELNTIVGIKRDRLKFDNVFLRNRNRNELTGFVRAVIGFGEYYRPY